MQYRSASGCFTLLCSLLVIGGCSTVDSSSPSAWLDDDFPQSPQPLSEVVTQDPILPLNLPPKVTLVANPLAPKDPDHPLSPYRTVYFPYDSWYLTPPNQDFLVETADVVKNKPQPIDILIEGHTDTQGTSSYNMILSKRRAAAIKEYLSDLGIQKRQLHIVSFGETHPSCTDLREHCHKFNRRAFLVFSPHTSAHP